MVKLTLGLFGKKRPATHSGPSPEPAVLSRLQEITGNDNEMYQSMSRLLFLDPQKITTSLEETVSQATNFESTGNKLRAEVWYRIAGGIARPPQFRETQSLNIRRLQVEPRRPCW
ncbi:hypothetical protein AUH73_00055 [archaeon 13_1_40CM_4_53_4]|nr:MAG: hypothetical protein AUH73_00055 [archaeon 13_1_40CM_4_53_4]